MSYAQNPRLAGLGAYAMATFTFWTPTEISQERDRFGRAVTATNNDVVNNRNRIIAAGAEGTRFWNDWQTFMRDYAAFAARTSTRGIIEIERGLVDRYNPLDSRFRNLSGVPTTEVQQDSRSAGWRLPFQDSLGVGGSLGLMAAAGLGVIGLVAVAVIATQARAFATPALTAMRRNRRRRR